MLQLLTKKIFKNTPINLYSRNRNLGTSILNSGNYCDIIHNRQKYLSPSLKTFEAYKSPLVLERGNMQYVYDKHNNKYLDMTSHNIVVSVGHSHPTVKKMVFDQIEKLPHCSTMYYNEKPGLLAKKLVEKLPENENGEDWVVHFVNNGSEAVDLAVQMAREYTGNSKMYGLYKGYHGLQGYAAGLTAIGKSTQNCYSTMYSSITHVEANNLEQLENSLKYGTSGNVAGIIIEPLQGYGGIYPLDKNYMKDAFSLIKKYSGVTISDEVQTGYGRLGEKFWGFEMPNNEAIPDIITIAKGMGNGMGIIGAVICRRSIAEAFTKKMFFNTFGSNPVSCTAALGVLKVFEEEDILNNSYKMGQLFNHRVNILCDTYPEIYKEIRGSGLFQGIEIYGKSEGESIRNSIELHNKTLRRGIALGRGSAAGNVFRIQPPMCILKEDVLKVIDILEEIAIERINDLRK